MQHTTFKVSFAFLLLAIMSGCSTQSVRVSNANSPFCTLAGAALGGGGAAAASLGGPPIAIGVMLGATIGNYMCSSDGQEVVKPVAVASTTVTKPEPVKPVRELDSDRDGVFDKTDRCPDTPAGSKVDAYGCQAILLTLTGVNFRHDSSQIDPASEVILKQAVVALNKANLVKVHILGHTDSSGTDEYNQKLSERRANEIQDYLIRNGIAAARLSADGAGEKHPLTTNSTGAGRYQNRRGELHVVNTSAMR